MSERVEACIFSIVTMIGIDKDINKNPTNLRFAGFSDGEIGAYSLHRGLAR